MQYTNFIKLLNQAYHQTDKCNNTVLFKYTRTITHNIDQIIYNVSNKSNIVYMNFPNNKCYLGIGQCLSKKIKSNQELKNLKNNKYNIISNTTDDLILLGGTSFDFEKNTAFPWSNIPKGKFVIPKLLITQSHNKIIVTYIRKIDRHILPASIAKEYKRYMNLINKKSKLTVTTHTQIKLNSETPSYNTYIKDINTIIQNIKNKPLNKVVISRIVRYSLSNNISLLNLIHYLNKNHTNCLNFIITFNQNTLLIGSTPEKIIQLKEGSFIIDAIAGSSKDKKNIKNRKEIDEHNFVIKHIKEQMNDIVTAISIPKNPRILNLSYIYHLYTKITGKMKSKTHILDVLTKLYPTPALLGDPHKQALNIINQYEKINRGWYGGSIGIYDNNGNGEFYVPIRSGLIKNKSLFLFTGSGIVSKSNAKKEWEETTLKLEHILSYFKN